MTDQRHILISCGIVKNEVEQLFARHSWACGRTYLTSSLHFDFDKLYKSLTGAIERNPDKEIVLLYGACHPGIDSLADTRRIPCQNCVEMLLGKQLFQDELEKGAYFLLEEWARDWEGILEKTFGNREVAREIFQGDRKYILALRTPCSGDFSEQAESAAASVGLPLRWMDVSLDHLEQLLIDHLSLRDEPQPEHDETIEELKEKLAYQQQRANRISVQKSYLELVNTMMNRLSALPGLENMLHNLLELVVDSLGGTTAGIYYFVDGSIQYVDLKGNKGIVDSIVDPLVIEALNSGIPVHKSNDFSDTLMQTRLFANSSTWVVPLVTGNSTVGLFKIENMHLESDDFLPDLGAFFRYAALILKNEIQNYVQLQQAYEKLMAEKDEHLASRNQLEVALSQVKRLEGIIPICMYCKKIRDTGELWHKLEEYISDHSDAEFTHGMCPDCFEKRYGSDKE